MPDLLLKVVLVSTILFFSGSLFFLLRLARERLNRNGNARAEITEIHPHFKKSSPLKTEWVLCRYSFKVKERTYKGECILPLNYFFPPNFGDPIIVFDVRIEMPVLYNETIRIVGEEGIEHNLLLEKESVLIRYLARDPSRNFFTGREELLEKERERKI